MGLYRAAILGCLNRKGFWAQFFFHFALSAALLAIFFFAWQLTGKMLPLWAAAPLRLVLIVPQVGIYLRRLRDAGRLGAVWLLLAVYALGLMAYAYCQYQIVEYDVLVQQGELDADEDVLHWQMLAWISGAGVFTGFPGPIQLAFALYAGTLKSVKSNNGRA